MRLFERRAARQQPASWPSCDPNLYGLWVSAPHAVLGRLRNSEPFNGAEITAASVWSERQRSWGLRADLHGAADGEASVLEVFGPDDLVPHCILYPAPGGVQADEFDGTSKVYPCIETALQEIAPLH